MTEKLESEQKFVYEGVVDYSVKIAMFGDYLTVKHKDEKGSAWMRIGGTSTHITSYEIDG